MGLFKIWKDHVTQFSNRYKEINNADGTITHEAVEGEVIQEGTPHIYTVSKEVQTDGHFFLLQTNQKKWNTGKNLLLKL